MVSLNFLIKIVSAVSEIFRKYEAKKKQQKKHFFHAGLQFLTIYRVTLYRKVKINSILINHLINVVSL